MIKSTYFKLLFCMLMMGNCFSSIMAMDASPGFEEKIKALGSQMLEIYEYDQDSLKKVIELTQQAKEFIYPVNMKLPVF